MPLHHSRDGYKFRADAQTLTIDPGLQPITLARSELEQLGLRFRDDYQVPLTSTEERGGVIDPIMSALEEAIRRCRGPEESWMALHLRRAMILVGGLDEKVAKQILDQEGV
jgi:hypothetical protein